MVAELEAQHLLLPQRPLARIALPLPVREGRREGSGEALVVHAEQAALAGAGCLLLTLGGGDRGVQPLAVQQRLALAQLVHGAALDERLDDALVERAQV